MISSIDITVIANDELAVTVAPALGDRMIELVDLQSGRRWLRRNHRVPLGSTPSGAVYDDVWQGGLSRRSIMNSETCSALPTSSHGRLRCACRFAVIDRVEATIFLRVRPTRRVVRNY